MADVADEDRGLVQLARQGDFNAFESLVSKYERRLFSLAMRIVRHEHDAEEVVQQTFLSVIEHLDGFREESTFHTWLTRIATNHALALLRKRSNRSAVEFRDDQSSELYADVPRPQYIARWHESPEQLAQQREISELLQRALDELDDKYRLVFLLRDVEGLSTSEAAEALNITESNVKVRLLRARLMLRERLTRVLGDPATQMAPGHDH